MSTQKFSQFGAEKFIQELLKSKEAKPLEDFEKAFFEACNVLRKRDYEILCQRYFGDGHKLITYKCIAETFGLSQCRVRDIIQRCFLLLRQEPTIFFFTEGHDYIKKRAVPYLARIKNGENPEDVYDIPIKDIGFNNRIFYCLKNDGITTLYELSKTTINDLLHIRNLGKKSVEYIVEICKLYGIQLKELDTCELTSSISTMSHDEIGSIDFRDLPLSPRVINCLIVGAKQLNFDSYTVNEVAKHTCAELLKIRNFGKTSLDEVKRFWKMIGFELQE